MCPCTSRRTSRVHRNLEHTSVPQTEKLFREAKVSDEATKALTHFSWDERNRAEATASLGTSGYCSCRDVQLRCLNGCELLEVEGTPKQREEDVDRSEHRGRSLGNAHCIQISESDISHAGKDFRARLTSLGWCAEVSQSGSSSCTDKQGSL